VAATPLFNAFGIPVRAHWSFWFLIFFVAWQLQEPGGIFPAAFGTSLLFMVCFMGCLLLHELGHCLVARRFGIQTREIKMTYIGGMAMFERSPREPRQELLVTAAGPLVNFLIAGLLFGGHCLEAGLSPGAWERGFFFWLMFFNLFLGLFNLVPGFPMDGGRILRSLLALKLPYLRATHIAVRVGQLVAVGFILWAFTPPFSLGLVLIGIFVLFLAQAELMRVRAEEALKQGSATLSRLFGGLFGGQAPGGGNGRSWGFTFGGQPPGGTEAEPSSPEPPSPPRDDSDCVIDMDPDGKVRKVWRKDESDD
tara:strand:+ start:42 stop:968 length:927 start_codon:yes stop_codon:yes gene_type:complete